MRLLSRNAESLFWLARYLERGASLARVVEMQSSFGGSDRETGWNWLLALHNDEERFREHHEMSAANIISFYVNETSNPGSIRSSIHWARENARSLRPFIPIEMWVQLNAFHGSVQGFTAEDLLPAQLPRTCAVIRAGCLAQIGIAEGTLFRDEGYQFFKLGHLIERADQTSRLLDVKFAQGATATRAHDASSEFVFWSTILRTAAAYQVYHRLEARGADPEKVARFLILNPNHPRSIGFCAREIAEALHLLRSNFRLSQVNECLEACDVLAEGLNAAAADAGLQHRLHEFNDFIQRTLYGMTDAIGRAFFQMQPPATPDKLTRKGGGKRASQKQKQQQS